MRHGQNSKTEWFSGLQYEGPYIGNRKHGVNGKLDFKNMNLTQNEQDYSTGPIEWILDKPKDRFDLPVRLKKNADKKIEMDDSIMMLSAAMYLAELP